MAETEKLVNMRTNLSSLCWWAEEKSLCCLLSWFIFGVVLLFGVLVSVDSDFFFLLFLLDNIFFHQISVLASNFSSPAIPRFLGAFVVESREAADDDDDFCR